MGKAGLAGVVAAVLTLVVIGATFVTPRTCYYGGYAGPDWVAERVTDGGLFCDPLWFEYLLPWHWGAEEVCIRCLEP